MFDSIKPRLWMKQTLLVAGLYNLIWGALAVIAPNTMLGWIGLDPLPTYPQFWQCIGMIVGVYGIGYLIAARNPYRHWPIVLVGLLGKIFGPIGFIGHLFAKTLPLSMGWLLLTNDLIWWIPFTLILFGALRFYQSATTAHLDEEFDDPVNELTTNSGQTLAELSALQPQLVVFLRHSGCTFCRESLSDLQQQRAQIESTGVGIVLVHLGSNADTDGIFAKYDVADLPRISDPQCRLYRQFGLELGGLSALMSPRVMVRGLTAAFLGGHGFGGIKGNPFQLPGAFVLHCGRFIRGFQHVSAADRPNYLELVDEVQPNVAGMAMSCS